MPITLFIYVIEKPDKEKTFFIGKAYNWNWKKAKTATGNGIVWIVQAASR